MKMNCVCCDKVLESMYDTGETGGGLSNHCWSDGVVENIHAGYGSRYDGSAFTLAICDDCLVDKVEKGVIFYDREYIFDIKIDEQERWLKIKKDKLNN